MSGPDRGREGGSPERAEPARTGTMVALLARRGRFLTAEPLFPARADGPSGPGRGASASLTLGSTRTLSPRAGARAGDLVLLQAGARGRGGKSSGARIVRVLGRPEIARDVIEALMLDRGLRRSFEQEVEREARAAGKRALRVDVQRRDLRELATFTIDPLSARDFDDAISAESIGDGVTRVWIHIADVGAHVPEWATEHAGMVAGLTAPAAGQRVTFTRPVYPYPFRAEYNGRGDPNDFKSFHAVESK